jgi:ubiquinone/menaquinone biosynthesis C-methylase UbiE
LRPKDRYYGDTALNYEQRRVGKVKWQRENRAVDTLVAELPSDATVLDVPIGTGRFLEFYQRYGLRAVGVDISRDMLELARKRADEIGLEVRLYEASVAELPLPSGSVDTTVCVRLVYSFSMAEIESVLRELARVTSGRIILSDRHAAPVTAAPVAAVPRALARRGKRSARNAWEQARGGTVKRFHRQDALLDVFRRVGLRVEDRVPIERLDGLFDYGIWLLRR